MKVDQVLVVGDIVLIPYCHHHVKKYHSWMCDPEIQHLTASGPLTLDEEYEMQKTWFNDPLKLTFILMDLIKWKKTEVSSSVEDMEQNLNHLEASCIIGDVNVFLNDEDDVGEVSIMIAEKNYRRKGHATEILNSIFSYVYYNLNLSYIIAKIGMGNAASLKLFTEKLSFKEVSRSNIFNEITLKRKLIKKDLKDFKTENYQLFRSKKDKFLEIL